MKLLIVGYGFVGKAIHSIFADKCEIDTFDPKTSGQEDIDFDQWLGDQEYYEVAFVCVPTPQGFSGRCDIHACKKVCHTLAKHGIFTILKSTVDPQGLTECFANHAPSRRAYVPEFLTEANWERDCLEGPVVVGTDHGAAFEVVRELYLHHSAGAQELYPCSTQEASFIKYGRNTFLALKVGFFNQLFDIVQDPAAFEKIRGGIALDPRIGNSHSKVPGHDGFRGFAGSCFPKDLAAFIQYAVICDQEPTILVALRDYNDEVRKNEEGVH